MPQHMRGDPARPVRQVNRCRRGQRRAQRLVAHPGGAAVGVAALGTEQRGAGPGVIIIEAAPHVLDEPPQGRPGAVDQRHHPLAWTGPAGALALADVQLPEPAAAAMRTRHSRDALDSLREHFDEKLFDTTIRASIAYAESAERALSILDYRPDLGVDYLNVADELLRRIGLEAPRRRVAELLAADAPAARAGA